MKLLREEMRGKDCFGEKMALFLIFGDDAGKMKVGYRDEMEGDFLEMSFGLRVI